jgi:hypothetical protein
MTLIDPAGSAAPLRQTLLHRASQDGSRLPQTPIDPNPSFSKHLSVDTVELSAKAKRFVSAEAPSAEVAAKQRAAAQGSPATYSRADVTDLLSNWGAAKPGSPHDLDGDGSVGASDLAQLIARLGTAKPQPASAQPESYTRADVDRLLEAWGGRGDDAQASERYDFDGDGSIGAADLAELISRLGRAGG